jgi:predicted alpha/beta-fold hydrolase
MKQPTASQLKVPPQPRGLSNGSIDTATLELLAAWKAEDATTDPEKLRYADEEVATFKKAMDENRAASGARLLFP